MLENQNTKKNTEKEVTLQRHSQTEFRIERGCKKKRNKLHVKWKGYDNWFNNWIDKKRHCQVK